MKLKNKQRSKKIERDKPFCGLKNADAVDADAKTSGAYGFIGNNLTHVRRKKI